MRRSDPRRDAELRALYETGSLTMREIADAIGLSGERVRQILKRAGCAMPGRASATPTDPVAIGRLAREGKTVQEIVDTLRGHQYGAVLKCVRALGIQVRKKNHLSVGEIETRRGAMVATLKALAAELGRTPTLAEFAVRYRGRPMSSNAIGSFLATQWGISVRVGHYCRTTTASLYERAGLTVREAGGRGHLSKPKGQRPCFDYERIRTLQASGKTGREIAVIMGCTTRTVSRVLHAARCQVVA